MGNYQEKNPTAIHPKNENNVDQSDVINFHKLKWNEIGGKKYKLLYEETAEYMSFSNDLSTPEELIKEILKLYLKSTEMGDNGDVINNIMKNINTDLLNISRLKKSSNAVDFICRLESFVDNLKYEIN